MVTAVITVVLFAVLMFGAALVIITHLTGENEGDVAFHIDGTWETDGPTYNDEHITYVFSGDVFSKVTETMIFDANLDIIENIRDFYRYYSGAIVTANDMDDGNFVLMITMDGTFALDGDSLLLLAGEGMLTELTFSWEGDVIIINDDRFVRR